MAILPIYYIRDGNANENCHQKAAFAFYLFCLFSLILFCYTELYFVSSDPVCIFFLFNFSQLNFFQLKKGSFHRQVHRYRISKQLPTFVSNTYAELFFISKQYIFVNMLKITGNFALDHWQDNLLLSKTNESLSFQTYLLSHVETIQVDKMLLHHSH